MISRSVSGKSRVEHSGFPWLVPIAVVGSDFVSLKPDHAFCNVQTDLGGIGAFFRPKASTVGYADCQLTSDHKVTHRFGSGRSLFYKGAYLKGVGRTILAANWYDPTDFYHGSGHLPASAAAREYLISETLAGAGAAEDCMVRCVGVLAKQIPPCDLEAAVAFSSEPSGGSPAAGRVADCDLRIQCVSVKAGGFSRVSNFTWLLQRLNPDNAEIIDFFRLLSYFSGTRPTTTQLSDMTPSFLVDQIEEAIDRGFNAILQSLALGVYWGSIHNNLTLDGRIVDLETAVIIGNPTLKAITLNDHQGPLHPGSIAGADLVFYLAHMEAALGVLVSGIRDLAERGELWLKMGDAA